MTLHDLLFWFFAALAVVPALLCVVVSKNIIRAAFLLMLSFWGVAGLYGTLAADFLMVVQLIVYVGGILVLILFGVMLSRRLSTAELPVGGAAKPMALLCAAFLGFFVITTLLHTDWGASAEPMTGETVAPIGALLLDQYLLPFEFVSVLLLAALVGSVVLARKEISQTGSPSGGEP